MKTYISALALLSFSALSCEDASSNDAADASQASDSSADASQGSDASGGPQIDGGIGPDGALVTNEYEEVGDNVGDQVDPLEVSLPMVAMHAIDPEGDIDCFRFALSSPRSIVIDVTSAYDDCVELIFGFGEYPIDPIVKVYASSGALLGSQDGRNSNQTWVWNCPLMEIDLPAGDFQVCVSGDTDPEEFTLNNEPAYALNYDFPVKTIIQ